MKYHEIFTIFNIFIEILNFTKMLKICSSNAYQLLFVQKILYNYYEGIPKVAEYINTDIRIRKQAMQFNSAFYTKQYHFKYDFMENLTIFYIHHIILIRTHSVHHPKILARFNSSSVQLFLTSNRNECATAKPRILLPIGTLYSFTCNKMSIRLKTLIT